MWRMNAYPLTWQMGPCAADFVIFVSGGRANKKLLGTGAPHPNFMLIFIDIIHSPEVRV